MPDKPQANPELIAKVEASLSNPAFTEPLGEEGIAFIRSLLAAYKAQFLATCELSPDREKMLSTLMTRYDQHLGKNLYSVALTPLSGVETFLRANPSILDTLMAWEAREGMPMFTGLEDGNLCFDECSPEVPQGIRDITYSPNAAKFAFGEQDRNSLTQSAKLGGTLMSKNCREKLYKAGLIKDANSWEWLLDASNRDLETEGSALKNYGIAWLAGCGDVPSRTSADFHTKNGGLRCSLRCKS